MSRQWKRLLLLGVGLLSALGVVIFVSGRVGFWSLGGVSVQVFDPNSTLFNSQGVLVCAASRAWGVPEGSKAELSYMHIRPETIILDQRTAFSPTPARSTDLQRGQRVRVWIRGGALFSYPSQVDAERVVIEHDGQPDALDCQWRGLAP
jgi:hypothetical protein